MFYLNTIDEEELRGVAVFAKGKLVQSPFLFHLTGGLSGQHGVEYLCGQIQADYLDLLPEDITTTERQRINWENTDAGILLDWGRLRIKSLLSLWRDRRGEERRSKIEKKVMRFSGRIEKLSPTEAKTVKMAIERIGRIEALNDQQFEGLCDGILTAWEQGRLKGLISELSSRNDFSETELIGLLVEEGVLAALNIAEVVKTKMLAIWGLKRRIEEKELENAVRDYIAANPWLISPELQTYKAETSLRKFIEGAGGKAYIPPGKEGKRIDLALSSGTHLILLEFMQPGLNLDWDHLNRYELYFRTIRTYLNSNTGGRFHRVTGYIIADSIDNSPVFMSKVNSMQKEEMYAMDWRTLFDKALSQWTEFLNVLASREPSDDRLKSLLDLKVQ